MRRALLLVANLALGALLLGWVLRRFGASALELLGGGVRPGWLLAFVAVAALTVAGFALRWQMLCRGLGSAPGLFTLWLYRSAGHSVGDLIPSARLGGDPLRAWLAVQSGMAPGDAVASVAVDRVLELGATVPFSFVFVSILLQRGVPDLERVLVTLALGAVGLAVGVTIGAYRLRHGRGLVTSLVRSSRLDRLRVVQGSMGLLEAAEAASAALVAQPRRLGRAFALGLAVNLLVLVEFGVLLAAFDLPAGPLPVVAAIFASATAHLLPVPAGIGVLEGGLVWLFGILGYAPEVGLAVGLAARLRELVWLLPGLLYLLARVLRASLARRSRGSEDRSTEWA